MKQNVRLAGLIAVFWMWTSCAPATRDEDRSAGPVNLALNKTAKSSGAYGSHLAANAIDGDVGTSWIVAGAPGGWIEVDLHEDSVVGTVELVVEQTPEGETIHVLMGRGSEEQEYRDLHIFSGRTYGGQVLAYSPEAPWVDLRFLRVETIQTPSWVAWKEIRILAPTGASEELGTPAR